VTAATPTGASTYALRLGDDCLILAQRLGEWAARAPEIEEDIALTNIGLDLLGQARTLLTHAGELEGGGRDEDALAFERDERDFVNCLLVELENGDFARTMGRLLLFSTYQLALYDALRGSADERLAAVAAKGVKEVAYHRERAALWTVRLGDGTAESHERMQAAIELLWPYAAELFVTDSLVAELVARGVAVDVASMRPAWEASVAGVLAEATLEVPQAGGWIPTGGRDGRHTEGFGYLIAEMQHLHRSYPGARW
jgi:ring-1,2-phenylacetyl-CoA epoxidase subunit PaaC